MDNTRQIRIAKELMLAYRDIRKGHLNCRGSKAENAGAKLIEKMIAGTVLTEYSIAKQMIQRLTQASMNTSDHVEADSIHRKRKRSDILLSILKILVSEIYEDGSYLVDGGVEGNIETFVNSIEKRLEDFKR